MMGGGPAQSRGLRCQRCGGTLVGGSDADQLRCTWCDTGFLRTSGSDVEASVPVGRLGRRRIVRALAEELQRHGVEGFAIEDLQLHFLPFWIVEGKLVGWQQYQRKVHEARRSGREGGRGSGPATTRLELVEEMVARPVRQALSACESRRHGLLGIADRLEHLRLRPFRSETLVHGEQTHAVLMARRSAVRLSERLASGALVPRGAIGLRQRVTLIRTRLRLIYYPVWWVEFTVGGISCEASLDALRGLILQGMIPVRPPSPSPRWLMVGAAGGWLSGSHPLPAVIGIALWALHRLRRGSTGAPERSAAQWLSEELGTPPLKLRPLAQP
jgi:hypothetical protein